MARKTDPVLEALAAVDIFSGLTAKQLHLIQLQGREMWFKPGEAITTQGKAEGRFYLILEGEVDVDVSGRKAPSLGPGSCFGEIALIDKGPRSATATARTPVRTWTLASFNFRPILEEHPPIARKIMLLLCQRLRAAEAELGEARAASH